MAITNTYAPVKISGDDVTVDFDFDFRVYEGDDVKVSFIDKDTEEVLAVKEYGTDYTVSVNAATSDPGGTVTFGASDIPSSDVWVLIESNIANEQPTSFGVDSKLSEKSIERALDRACRLIQQLAEQLGRSLKIPASLSEEGIDTILPVPEAEKFLAWNDAGDGLENRNGEFTAVDYTGTISAGLYANRPAAPSTDDIYIATDTSQFLVCFSGGTWTAVGGDGAYFTNLANIPSGAGRIPKANLPLVRPVTVVDLTDGATINLNAALGDYFKVTLGGNRTLANPTNPTDGQTIVVEFIQDATGSRTITLGSDFIFGTDVTSVTLTTTASKRDLMICKYRNSKWLVLGFVRGYA